GPVVADDTNIDLRSLADVLADLIELPVLIGGAFKDDVTGGHAKGFEPHSHSVAVVLQLLEGSRVEGSAERALGGNESFAMRRFAAVRLLVRIGADGPDPEAQIVLEVLLAGQGLALDDMVVRSHVHLRVPFRHKLFLRLPEGRSRICETAEYRSNSAADKCFPKLSSLHRSILPR